MPWAGARARLPTAGGLSRAPETASDFLATLTTLSAVTLACTLLDGAPARTADVYMGSIIDEREATGEMSIAFGNCCPESRAFDLRIRGCPPYPFALKGSLKIDRR